MSPAPARVDELKKRYEENPRRFFAPLANEYRKAGDLEAAIDLCRMHLEEQPGHLSGHIVYGQALFESSRPAEAKQAFEAALALDPENLIALRHLGDIARAEGDAAAATSWYQRVLDADPRNDEVIALIADLQKPAAASTVVVSEEQAPPPPPSYAVETPAAIVDPHALTPVISYEPIAPAEPIPEPPTVPTAIPATVLAAARPSIGLMDLDLNLSESTESTVDLLGDMPPEPPPAAEMPSLLVEEPAPEFEEGFPIADTVLPAAAGTGPELLGADDTNLGFASTSESLLEPLDTSFDAALPADAPMFAETADVSAFGGALDITASAEPALPPPTELMSELPSLLDEDHAPIAEPITSASALHAEPAAPTSGDFDMLFGNAPIADVQIGGDSSAPAESDLSGFTADSFIGREPTDAMLELAPDIATPPSPFVTETMAELYLQQGFRDEALDVYRQLLAQNPGDTGLAERVRHLEHGSRSSLPIDGVSEEIEAAAIASEAQRAVVEPAPVEHEPVEQASVEQERIEHVAAAPPVEAAPVPAPVATPALPTGPSLRSVLARIANRRGVPGGGMPAPAAADVGADTAPLPSAPAEEGLSIAAEPAPVVNVSAGGSIDRLFDSTAISDVDELAAASVSAAFGGAAAAPIKGEPTRAGTDELSLDSVFKGEAANRPAAVPRQSSKLRFDQFFAGADGASSPASPDASTAAPAPGRGPEDIAQFTDWLKGLKGS